MNIYLKNRPGTFFSNNPAIVVAGMFVTVILLVIVGASQKEVTIIDDFEKKQVVTYKGSVHDILEQNKIELNPKDKISPSPETITKDGENIVIKRAVPVDIVFDGTVKRVVSSEQTVGDVLAAEGITYGKTDKVYPELDTIVSKDMEIRVVRIAEEEITETLIIPYAKEVKQVSEWEVGKEVLTQNGADGEKTRKIKITYEDGVEKKREVIEEKIVKPVVNEILSVGAIDTRVVPGGETISFNKMLVMKATSYTDDIACTGKIGGNTATGTKPRRIPGGGRWSTVAVDPKVIKLGTKLWVEGYGFAIAEDVGGAVKGNIIDLFFTRGSEEYARWSTHKVKVYILR